MVKRDKTITQDEVDGVGRAVTLEGPASLLSRQADCSQIPSCSILSGRRAPRACAAALAWRLGSKPVPTALAGALDLKFLF